MLSCNDWKIKIWGRGKVEGGWEKEGRGAKGLTPQFSKDDSMDPNITSRIH